MPSMPREKNYLINVLRKLIKYMGKRIRISPLVFTAKLIAEELKV